MRKIRVSTEELEDGLLRQITLLYADGRMTARIFGPEGYPLKNTVMVLTLKRKYTKKKTNNRGVKEE